MRRLPAEFEPQSFVQLIFPHAQSDWLAYLEEASQTFVEIVQAIVKHEPCLLICEDVERVQKYFDDETGITFVQYQSDDTWARDCSAISIYDDEEVELLDYTFNGWGDKFDATLDDAMTSALAATYGASIKTIDLVLEGGAIESDGQGTLLTTSQCLLNPNRNPSLTQTEIESALKKELGLKRILWLHHGYLSGDDTDSHIDTLARLIATDTIMYVHCDDRDDEHFEELTLMEEELKALRQDDDTPYRLIALPMCEPIYYDSERLPATYANFLMIDGAVILPVYGVPQDREAIDIFEQNFPEREIIPVDCSVLIRQHGSLHCVTMQFPKKTKINI